MPDNVYQKKNISLPCHKYMVRRIDSEADKLEYARSFFIKLYGQGYDVAEIISGYIATAHFQETKHFDFLSHHGKTLSGESFYYSVMEDASIPSYKNCQAYVKKYDKDITPVCKTCPCCSRYANNKREEELSVLKKINASYNSLQLFLSRSNASFFKYCIDIVENTSATTPLVIPFYRLGFHVIKSCGASYYEQDILNMSDSQRLSMLQNRMFAELKKKYDIDARMPNYIHLFPLIYSSFVEEIEHAADITDADLDTFLTLRHETGAQKQGSLTAQDKENVCNQVPDSLPEISADTFLLQGNGRWVTQYNKQSPVSVTGTDRGDKEKQHYSMPDADSLNPSNLDGSRSFTNLVNVLNEIEFPCCKNDIIENPQTDRQSTGLNRATEDHISFITEGDQTSMETSETINNMPVISQDNSSVMAPILAGDIPLPCIKAHRLVDNLTPIEDKNIDLITLSIIKDGELPLECIIDDGGNYAMILWIRPLKQFFYTYFINMHERIKKAFSHKRIRKFCYQPYYLYSLCKIHDIQIKHVYSFHSVHLRILNTEHYMSYREIVELYTEGKCYGYPIDTLDELIEFMGGIPFYRSIHRVQTKLIASNEKYSSYIEDMENMDEVLGMSYLRSINFYDNSTLLTIQNGQLHFNRCISKHAKREGFLVTYVIEDGEIDQKIKRKIYLSLLCDLSRAGRIRKMNLQLMTLYDDIMVLFVGAAEYEFITTYNLIHLYKIAQKYGCTELNVNVSHERCSPECDV